jgi:mono/diheme cytochrome c family protein
MTSRANKLRGASAGLLTATVAIAAACSSAAPPETGPAPGETTTSPPAAESAAEPVGTASFTVRQADRGQYDFGAVCGDCHSTSEFRGDNFLYKWRRRTAWDFYKLITTTMPENAPGSLSDEQYVDVIAYILQMNGFEAGAGELPATKAALDQFVMDGAPDR